MTQFVSSPIFITSLCICSILTAAPQRETHLIYCLHPPRGGNGYCFISIGYFNLNRTRSSNGDRGRMRAREREREDGGEKGSIVIWHYRWYLSPSLFFLSGSNCGYSAFERYCLVSRIVIGEGEGSYVFNTLLLCCDLPVRKVARPLTAGYAQTEYQQKHAAWKYTAPWINENNALSTTLTSHCLYSDVQKKSFNIWKCLGGSESLFSNQN